VPATLLFFAAGAAGTLTKGPVALALPMLIGLLYLAITREWRQVRWGAAAAGAAVYTALVVPWFAAVQARYPGFLHYFFIGENLQRFAGNEHPEPLWFYVPILVLGFGVWIPSLFPTLVDAFRTRREWLRTDPVTLLALLWAGVIFAFFSISKGKLPTYVLPCFPPLALLIGRYWSLRGTSGAKPTPWLRLCAGAVAVGMVIVAAALNVLIPQLTGLPRGAELPAVWLVGCGALAAGYSAFRGNDCTRFGAIAAAGALLTLAASEASDRFLANNTAAGPVITRILVTRFPPDARLVLYREDGLTALQFYLGRTFGSSRRLQDIPALERPPIDGDIPGAPSGRNSRRRRNVNTPGPSTALSSALKQPGPMMIVMQKEDAQRLHPLLASTGAEQFFSSVGDYVIRGRLTSGPPSGKSPVREPVTTSGGLKDK
jgi:hypothetical protein